MQIPTVQVLLIQDNFNYAVSVRRELAKESDPSFHLKAVSSLQSAVNYLNTSNADIILLELSLPDGQGLETFEKIQSAAPNAPVVVLTTFEQELNALKAVQKGAQDYLLKTQDETKILLRVIRCALERHRMKQELLQLSFTDELTGLHNRRGFSVLAEQQIKYSKRSQKGFLLILLDLDDFKRINDNHGHNMGDFAINQAAELLRKTFRQSDVIARIGGDEFAVLALEAGEETKEIIYQRLDAFFQQHNNSKIHPFQLSVSAGASYFDPLKVISFEELFEIADGTLYEKKRLKNSRQVDKKAS
jgi:two-component system, cell cycle response regulator